MPAQANIEIQIHSSNICIVTLRGEHDAASSEAVTLALAAARHYGNILVDLGECTFVDSSLISALLLAAKRARQLGGALELVVPVEANAVRRTLEIANVQMLLPFHATREPGSRTSGRRGRAGACPASARRSVGSRPQRHPAGESGSLILRAQVVRDSVSLDDDPVPADWGERAA